MKNRLAVVAMLTVTGWLGTSQAQEGAPAAPAAAPAAAPQAPKPPPENDVIKKSVGTWSCTATGKGSDGQDLKYKATWSIKPTLGGHWYVITYKRSKMGPMPAFEGNATVGYNTAEKKYSFIGFDNFGGWINTSSTDGAVYTGQNGGMGKVSTAKFSFAPGKDKKGEESDKLFDVTMEFGAAFNSTENCKK